MAAGLGFKDFTTGEVLTAADVDGYLMQGIWVFANAAARDAAVTSPQEGNCCYLKDTDAVQTYNGSAWVGFDDSNAIQNSIVDAKGDIVAASGNDTPARLAVGANGTTIVADSSTTTGLAYIPTFFAGKNKIINGDFGVWQRGAGAFTSDGTYSADRYNLGIGGSGTLSVTRESFTPGSAPVAGYESQYFLQAVTATTSGTNDYKIVSQYIEDVRTFAGQTTTFSFWAKASSGTPKIAIEVFQSFGSGGSSNVFTYGGQVTLSTSWTRYSLTISIPSVSGKTIGASSFLGMRFWFSAGSDFNARTGSLGNQNGTFQIWGVQLESGSTATSFQTATGTIQGELAACQRYYFRYGNGSVNSRLPFWGYGNSTTAIHFNAKFPQTMRVAPSTVEFSTVAATDGSVFAATALTLSDSNPDSGLFVMTIASGGNQFRPYLLIQNNNTAGYVGVSAEL